MLTLILAIHIITKGCMDIENHTDQGNKSEVIYSTLLFTLLGLRKGVRQS